MPPSIPPVEELNSASRSAFGDALAPLFEGAPRFLGHLTEARPFTSAAEVFEAARSVAHAMPEADQIELLDAHPPIGADAAAMSQLSRGEQGAGGSADETRAVSDQLRDLNRRYEARFGFRFVIFVAGRSRDQIVPLLEAALEADRAAELRRGLDDVVAIAEDRLFKLRAVEESSPTIGA